MKLLFKTIDPTKLKSDIIDIIKKKNLETWSIFVSNSKEYLKHTKQWGDKGVISLSISSNDILTVQVLKFDSVKDSLESFEGYYLGRFCEVMLVNFANRFSSIENK